MMDRCGADAVESFRQGVTNLRLYRDCLERCAGCKATEACRKMLEESGAPLEAAPDYCENKNEIAAQKEWLRRALN